MFDCLFLTKPARLATIMIAIGMAQGCSDDDAGGDSGAGDRDSGAPDSSVRADAGLDHDGSSANDMGAADAALADGSASNADGGAGASGLIGSWEIPCVPRGPGVWASAVMTFKDNGTWDLAMQFANAENGCDDPIFRYGGSGPFNLGATLGTPAGAREIDFIVEKRAITLLKEAARGVLSGFSCDASSWALEEERDISATGCGVLAPSVSACGADYDIYRLEGTTSLFFGQRPEDNNMCTEDRRPTTISEALTFSRKSSS